jgi:hypothetical protein
MRINRDFFDLFRFILVRHTIKRLSDEVLIIESHTGRKGSICVRDFLLNMNTNHRELMYKSEHRIRG